ncbi:MAG: FHA domain-containing protein [Pseudomonadota bacterium]
MTSRLKSQRLLSKSVGGILEFLDGEDQGRKVPLLLVRTTLGRKIADVLVRDLKVSGTHAAVEWRNGAFWIVDLESSNGTFVGERKVEEARLAPGQEVRIGLTRFRIQIDPEKAAGLRAANPLGTARKEGGLAELIREEFVKETEAGDSTQTLQAIPAEGALEFRILLGPLAGKIFAFKGPNILIGRKEVDFSLKDPDVSRKHALIERQPTGQVVIRDLASRNGTYVNDRRVSNCVLSKGDHVRLGRTTLVFGGTGS